MDYLAKKFKDKVTEKIVSFFSTDDNIVCEDGRTLRENLAEIDNQITNRGAWSSSTDYKVNDMVISDNFAYICTVANKNQKPSSESTYWVNFNRGGSGSGSVEETVTTYVQQNPRTTAYLADTSSYTDDNYSTVSVSLNHVANGINYDVLDKSGQTPLGQDITVSATGTIYFTNEDTCEGWNDSCAAGTYTVYNLEPESWYSYVVRDDTGKVKDFGRIKGTGKIRWINADGWNNARDIGGWDADGGTVKYGMIYRGAQMSYVSNGKEIVMLSDATLKRVKNVCKIRTEIDLRSEDQTVGIIDKSCLGDEVEYLAYPYTEYDVGAMMNVSGIWKEQTKAVLEHAMNSVIKGAPVYIHCQAGADRTGGIFLPLEGLLGMTPADCDRDYELTSLSRNETTNGHRRTGTYWVDGRNYFNSFSGNTLQEKIMNWCHKMGIQKDLVNRYRKSMIDGTPTELSYNNDIEMTLNNVASSNSTSNVVNGKSYTTTLTATSGYTFSVVSVTMDGIDVTSSVYDSSTHVISILKVTGDIIINASAINNAMSITYNLTDVTSSNTVTSVSKGNSYTTTLTQTSGYSMDSVMVTMDGKDVTSSVYNSDTQVVSISSVTGVIVITASANKARVNLLTLAVDSDGTPYNSGTGIKADYRINSMGLENAKTGAYCTGFIPVSSNDVLVIENFHIIHDKTGNYTNCGVAIYDKDFNMISGTNGYAFNRFNSQYDTTDSNGYITRWVYLLKNKSTDVAYFRVGSDGIGENPAIYLE